MGPVVLLLLLAVPVGGAVGMCMWRREWRGQASSVEREGLYGDEGTDAARAQYTIEGDDEDEDKSADAALSSALRKAAQLGV